MYKIFLHEYLCKLNLLKNYFIITIEIGKKSQSSIMKLDLNYDNRKYQLII